MEICYMYRYLFVIGALILMTGITGCSEVNSSHHYEAMPFERQTPGNPTTNDYALHFRVDYKVVEQKVPPIHTGMAAAVRLMVLEEGVRVMGLSVSWFWILNLRMSVLFMK